MIYIEELCEDEEDEEDEEDKAELH